MLLFKRISKAAFLTGFVIVASLGFTSCTVQPLNAVKPDSTVSPTSQLSGVEILEVTTRVGQQVRNHLVFGLNGGGQPAGATHTLSLVVTERTNKIAIVTSTQAPTAAMVTVAARYRLKENASGETIAMGIRQAIASYDQTNQSFANQRAERDAENRAAKEVAEQLRLVVATSINGNLSN